MDTPFVVTEWDWFRMKLDLHGLQLQVGGWPTRFSTDRPGKIRCEIWRDQTQRLVAAGADHDEQLDFYASWVAAEQHAIHEILKGLPALRAVFDVDRDVTFEILHDYGTGSRLICRFRDGDVTWHDDLDQGLG